jgi:hypothetical protein
MSSASNSAIYRSLPVGCCLVARHPIRGVTASRLIHIQEDPPGEEVAWLVDLGNEAVPTSQPLSDLVAMVEAEDLTVWHWTPRIPATLRKSLSAVAVQQADTAWHRIEPLTGSQNMSAMVDDKQRGKLIKQRAVAAGCGRTQIYRAWVRYLQCGMTADALIPRIETSCPKPWSRRE